MRPVKLRAGVLERNPKKPLTDLIRDGYQLSDKVRGESTDGAASWFHQKCKSSSGKHKNAGPGENPNRRSRRWEDMNRLVAGAWD